MKTELGNSHSTKFKTKWSGLFQVYQVGSNFNYYLEDSEGVCFSQLVNGSALNSTTLSLAGECDSVNDKFNELERIH
ncbi:hypothetical protein DSO57_1010756 [Entomophthora muscae]|uniref:Uncharacterized protein n=1 Tax=Entomophthora muscae TaxID=34485 RepID=A0ACC2TH47_9FUNG|nr:hypothetical protein DSO57_1010756 [Entomophthora muscae]